MTELPIIEQRRIEAAIVKPIYEELVAELGEEGARGILSRAIRKSAIEQARALAAESPPRGLADFARLLERWTANGALELEISARDERRFEFDVRRCRYAEMYRDMGLESIGHLLSCQRDGAFCEGYDERLSLERSQTLMSGASHCDFRYRYRD